MLVELPAGSWGNLMKTFQDKYGATPLPRNCLLNVFSKYFEEMVQDRLFYAESFAQVVSLDTENEHRLSNLDTHSQHIPMLFDGSTIRLLASSHVLNAVDLEDFRSEYEIIANVWRMMKLRSPRRWLMDSRRIGMELEVSPGVMRAPLWQLCMSYEHDVREAAMDITRMQGLPLAEGTGSGEKRPRTQDDPLGATVDATRTSTSHFRTTFLFKFFQLSQTLRASFLQQSALGGQSAREQTGQAYSSGGKGLERSRSPRGPRRKTSQSKGAKGNAKGGGVSKGKNSHFEDLVKRSTKTSSSSNVRVRKSALSSKTGNALTRVAYELMCAQDVGATRRGYNANA